MRSYGDESRCLPTDRSRRYLMRTRALVVTFVMATSTLALRAENWPQWRGPSLNGVSTEKNLPVEWTTEENVTWKLELPEWSGSTPIIWGERIFLNVAKGDDLYLWCVNRNTADPLWVRPLGSGNVKIGKQNMSSPSPVMRHHPSGTGRTST